MYKQLIRNEKEEKKIVVSMITENKLITEVIMPLKLYLLGYPNSYELKCTFPLSGLKINKYSAPVPITIKDEKIIP